MPVTNITNVEHKLFALCCLTGSAREQIREVWDKRFSPKKAFWVDADSDSVMTILQSFRDQLEMQRITSMAGETCLITMFLDFTQDENQERLEELCQLPKYVETHFGCKVATTLQFGHLGVLDHVSNKNKHLVDNTKRVVDINTRQRAGFPRLYLVATPFLGAATSCHWKSALVLMDLLRRNPHPSDILPQTKDGTVNNDLGFIRYTEFCEGTYEMLEKKVEELKRQIGNRGLDDLGAAISEEMSRVSTEAERLFEIGNGLQPLHPNMLVVDNSMFKKNLKKAKRGMLDTYNMAQQETRYAIEATVVRMMADIKQHFTLKDPAGMLEKLRIKSRIGIDCFSDRSAVIRMMEDIRNVPVVPSQLPNMSCYREDGYTREIFEYLQSRQKYAISEGRRNFVKQLMDAYNAISDEVLMARKQEIQEELSRITQQQEAVPASEKWIDMILYGTPAMDGVLDSKTVQHETKTYMMVREEQYNQYRSKMDNATGTRCYYMEKRLDNGLVELDLAPMKAMRLGVADCSDEFLKNLIPWEEV